MEQAIEYLAKTCANIIKAQGLSKPDAILVASKVVTLVASGEVCSATPGAPAERVEEQTPPPPPTVIAKAGVNCVCAVCQATVYHRKGDIMSTMKGAEFMDAFTPIGHDVLVEKFQNIEGNVLVDCPVCGASSSVALVGKTLEHQYKNEVVA